MFRKLCLSFPVLNFNLPLTGKCMLMLFLCKDVYKFHEYSQYPKFRNFRKLYQVLGQAGLHGLASIKHCTFDSISANNSLAKMICWQCSF